MSEKTDAEGIFSLVDEMLRSGRYPEDALTTLGAGSNQIVQVDYNLRFEIVERTSGGASPCPGEEIADRFMARLTGVSKGEAAREARGRIGIKEDAADYTPAV